MTGSLPKLLIACLLLAAAAAGYSYLRLEPEEPPAARAATAQEPASSGTAVEAVEVEVGPVVDAVAVSGSLRSDEETLISTEIAGRINGIRFDEGEVVEQGELLFTLDDAIYLAELAEAEANLALSERNFERATELLDRRAGSARARDEALARMEIDRASVNLMRTRLDKTRIRAPFDGVVGLRRVSVGAYVTPGQDLVNLEDIEPIKVDFSIPERLLEAVETGQAVEVRVEAWPERTFEGEVYVIAPQIDASGRSITLSARIDNEDRRLRPGLFARVRLIVDRREEALLIPEQAIFAESEKRVVYKVVDGKARLTEVEIGARRAGQVEIVSGLERGDVVVSAGHEKLSDGAAVRVVEPPSADDDEEVS